MAVILLISTIYVFLVTAYGQEGRPSEDERCELWHQNGNVWPPNWQEESDSMKDKMRIREEEIMAITGSSERYVYKI